MERYYAEPPMKVPTLTTTSKSLLGTTTKSFYRKPPAPAVYRMLFGQDKTLICAFVL